MSSFVDMVCLHLCEQERKDDINVSSGDRVHFTCRRKYRKSECVENGNNAKPPPEIELRSSGVAFNFIKHLILFAIFR